MTYRCSKLPQQRLFWQRHHPVLQSLMRYTIQFDNLSIQLQYKTFLQKKQKPFVSAATHITCFCHLKYYSVRQTNRFLQMHTMVTNVERGRLVGCNLCNVSTARSQCVDVQINIRWIREKCAAVMCIPQDQCSRSHLNNISCGDWWWHSADWVCTCSKM